MTFDANHWLDAALSELELEPISHAGEALCQSIRAEKAPRQIALLKACVARLPVLRQRPRDDRHAYLLGSVLYSAACTLYGERLPYRELDICDLLRTARHDCGHGADVTPPVDAAFDHARRFGVSAELIDAMRAYAGGLTGAASIKAKHVKRRAALLYLLDPEVRDGEKPCWSHRLRTGLAQLPPEERVQWHGLILQMSIGENPRMPKTWRRVVDRFIGHVDVDVVLTRLEQWWPDDPHHVWSLQSGGSQFLKHAVWMLGLIRDGAEKAPARCDALVLHLARVDWQPRERAKKVFVAAAGYLARRPPEVSWDALLGMAEWSIPVKRSDGERNRIADMVVAFARAHGLTAPVAVTAAVTVAPPAATPRAPAPAPALWLADPPLHQPAPAAAVTGWFGRLVAAARRLVS